MFEQVNGETKINRHYYELFVLEKLEQGVVEVRKVYVEGDITSQVRRGFRRDSSDGGVLHCQGLGRG